MCGPLELPLGQRQDCNMMNHTLTVSQDRYLGLARDYFAGSLLSNTARLCSFPYPSASTCLKISGEVAESYTAFVERLKDVNEGILPVVKHISPYTGPSKVIFSLATELRQTLGEWLFGAYVFGSIGNGEEVNYSDLDCLLIFRNAVFQDRETLAAVCAKVFRASRFLTAYDALQHHGFFVLSETDLKYYPEVYLPLATFDDVKSIIPLDRHELSITARKLGGETDEAFYKMASVLSAKVPCINHRINYYRLKLLLSQVMLMPALYLNALGVFVSKRDSFSIASARFPADVWGPIQTASAIRRSWAFQPSVTCRLLQRISVNPFLVTMFQAKIGQRPPRSVVRTILGPWQTRLLELLEWMRRDVAARKTHINRPER